MSRVEISETIGPDPVTAIYSGNGMASGDVIGAVVRNDYVESKPFYTDNFLNHSYQVSLNPDVVTKPSNFNWKFDEDGNENLDPIGNPPKIEANEDFLYFTSGHHPRHALTSSDRTSNYGLPPNQYDPAMALNFTVLGTNEEEPKNWIPTFSARIGWGTTDSSWFDLSYPQGILYSDVWSYKWAKFRIEPGMYFGIEADDALPFTDGSEPWYVFGNVGGDGYKGSAPHTGSWCNALNSLKVIEKHTA